MENCRVTPTQNSLQCFPVLRHVCSWGFFKDTWIPSRRPQWGFWGTSVEPWGNLHWSPFSSRHFSWRWRDGQTCVPGMWKKAKAWPGDTCWRLLRLHIWYELNMNPKNTMIIDDRWSHLWVGHFFQVSLRAAGLFGHYIPVVYETLLLFPAECQGSNFQVHQCGL